MKSFYKEGEISDNDSKNESLHIEANKQSENIHINGIEIRQEDVDGSSIEDIKIEEKNTFLSTEAKHNYVEKYEDSNETQQKAEDLNKIEDASYTPNFVSSYILDENAVGSSNSKELANVTVSEKSGHLSQISSEKDLHNIFHEEKLKNDSLIHEDQPSTKIVHNVEDSKQDQYKDLHNQSSQVIETPKIEFENPVITDYPEIPLQEFSSKVEVTQEPIHPISITLESPQDIPQPSPKFEQSSVIDSNYSPLAEASERNNETINES